ncbi:MAG: hypothetical protein ACR2IS_19665 [Nitrososphaeraceae archaeon]
MNVKLLTFNMGILTAATIVLLEYIAFPSIFAQTTTPPPTITSHASTNATLDTILGTPFFEDRGSKVTVPELSVTILSRQKIPLLQM